AALSAAARHLAPALAPFRFRFAPPTRAGRASGSAARLSLALRTAFCARRSSGGLLSRAAGLLRAALPPRGALPSRPGFRGLLCLAPLSALPFHGPRVRFTFRDGLVALLPCTRCGDLRFGAHPAAVALAHSLLFH